MSTQKNSIVPSYILKKLILIYGFNNFKLQKIKESYNGKFYLVNTEWLNKFKDFYNYDILSNYFNKNIIFQKKYSNYEEFEKDIENILKEINSLGILQKGNIFPSELNSQIPFVPKIKMYENNIYYYEDFYIINEKIFNDLCQDNDNPIKSNYPKFCSNFYFDFYFSSNIIFCNNDIFEIGKINEKGLFISQYHIKLDDIKPETEIKIIMEKDLENYFKIRQYNKNDKKYLNILFNQGKIGIIFNIIQYKEDNNKNKNEDLESNNNKKDENKMNNVYQQNQGNFHQSNNNQQLFNNNTQSQNPFNQNNPQQNIQNQNQYQQNYQNIQNQIINSQNIFHQNQNINNQIQNQQMINNQNNQNLNQNVNMQIQNQQMLNNQNNNNFQQNNYQNFSNLNQFPPNVNNNQQNLNNQNQNNIFYQQNYNQSQNNFFNYQQKMNNQNQFNQNCQIVQNQQNLNYYINNCNQNNNQLYNQQNNYNQNNKISYNTQNNFNNQGQMNIPRQSSQKAGNTTKSTNTQFDISKLTELKQLPYVPLIGLNNIGQTCFMNSVLQCFSNLYYITNYFLNPKKKEIINSNLITMLNTKAPSLSVAYKELIDNLWKGKPNNPYSPKNFKKIIGELNALFKDENAGDSKDFACFLVMQLHSELNNIDNSLNSSNNLIQQENKKIDPYNQKEVFTYFVNDFLINQNSIISQYFYGMTESKFECQLCKMKRYQKGIMTPLYKYTYENFFFLEFPLEEVRKYVFQQNNMRGINNGMNYQNINEVNIIDCFNYYQKQEQINGYCDKCGANNFPQNLDLTKIVLNNSQIYELQSVIKHFGDSSSSGHFIAYCRAPIPNFHNNWYCYNDSIVVQANNWDDIVNNGDTYILFYQLKKS
jgi:ubiquitin C-terminal hydrolase